MKTHRERVIHTSINVYYKKMTSIFLNEDDQKFFYEKWKLAKKGKPKPTELEKFHTIFFDNYYEYSKQILFSKKNREKIGAWFDWSQRHVKEIYLSTNLRQFTIWLTGYTYKGTVHFSYLARIEIDDLLSCNLYSSLISREKHKELLNL